jgi:uncharacterized membrane protein YphA (DoxX/SURF4 family)
MPTRLLEPRPAPPSAPAAPQPASHVVRWLDRLMDTTSEGYLTACRLLLGGVMFAHASQKVLGLFGGPGWLASLKGFHEGLGIPLPFAMVAIVAEFLGAVGLILGFLGRVAALCIIAVMTGAILLVHLLVREGARGGIRVSPPGHRPGAPDPRPGERRPLAGQLAGSEASEGSYRSRVSLAGRFRISRGAITSLPKPGLLRD